MVRHSNSDTRQVGPTLNARLAGKANTYKPCLDRERLEDPNEGVSHFKHYSRPHCVTCVESVFVFRFYQLPRFYRGTQYLLNNPSYERGTSIHGWTCSNQTQLKADTS